MQHHGTKSALRAMFHGNDGAMVADELIDQPRIQRFGKAGVGNGRADPCAFQFFRRSQAFRQRCAQRQQRHIGTLFHHAPLADLQHLAPLRHVHPHTVAARIAEGDGAGIMRGGGRNHMHQLGLVCRSHHGKAGKIAEIGQIKGARMRCPIGPDKAGPIDGKADRQALQRHIMHDLVVAPLQEGGIDGAERTQAGRGHAGGKGDGVLLGDAHIEDAVGHLRCQNVNAGARRHGGGHGDDPAVVPGFLKQGLAEDLGIAWRVRF